MNHFSRFRRLLFILIFFFTTRALFSSSSPPDLELFSSLNVNIPKTVYEKEDFTLSTFNLTYGLKLTALPFDFRFYENSSSIKLIQLQDLKTFQDFQNQQKKSAWSFNLDFSKIPDAQVKLPCSVSIGTLNFSQAVSFLKSPSFYSNPSPFSSSLSVSTGLGISGAQKSASERPIAFSFSGKTSNFAVETAITENSDFLFAFFSKFELSDFIRTALSGAFTTFSLSPKNQTSYKNQSSYFTMDKQWTTCIELMASVPLFQTKLSFGAVSNPFSTIRFFTTFEYFFHYGIFHLSGGIFFADTAFINQGSSFYTMSGNLEKNIYQFKITPAFTVFCKNATINSGITALYDYSLNEEGYNQKATQTLSLAAGTSVLFEDNYIYFLYRMNNLVLGEFSGPQAHSQKPFTFSDFDNQQDLYHSFSITFTRYFKDFNLSIRAKESFSEKKLIEKNEHNQTITVSSGIKNCPLSNASFSVNLDYKNNSVTPKFTLGITLCQIIKKLKITGKIQVCSTLLVE